ncbi:MAG: hypothetical protein IMW99_07045 [Firmicutes bacterium]|nr:hypothetical protein [Bacillota bacterium]
MAHQPMARGDDLYSRVEDIVEDYMDSFKSAYSDLNDLDSTEREELLSVIQDETGLILRKADYDNLVDKEDLSVDDIAAALERARPMDPGGGDDLDFDLS